MVKLADTQDLGSCTVVCRFKSCHPHQTRIKRTREKILGSFCFMQEILRNESMKNTNELFLQEIRQFGDFVIECL